MTRYLALDGSGAEATTLNQHERRFIAPYDGYVEKIVSRVSNDVGNLIYTPLKNTTSDDGDFDSTDTEGDYTSMGSVTVNVGSGHNQNITHTFGTSYSFNAGDVLALQAQTTSDGPDDLDMTMVLMFNITT